MFLSIIQVCCKFQLIEFFFFSTKRQNYYEVHTAFRILKMSFNEMSYNGVFTVALHCPSIKVIHVQLSQIWWFFILSQFMYLLPAFLYQQIAWHIPPLTTFYTINNLLILFKRSNFTLIFLNAACNGNADTVSK